MNPNQGILPGCEEFFKPTQKRQWNPVPHTLARVKSYLMGYHVNGRPIKARVKWMADRLGIGRSTLCRYLRWLVQNKWLETIKRTTRAAIRKVLVSLGFEKQSETPSETRIEVNPQSTKVLRQEMFTPSVIWVSPSNQKRDSKPKPDKPLMPEGLGFEVYRRLRQKLRDSLPWIEKALNRRAYERAIVKQELKEMGIA